MTETENLSQESQSGMALLISLFLTMLTGLLLMPIMSRAMFHHNNSYRETRYITALHLAEAGIDEGVWHLSYDHNDEWAGWDISSNELYTKPSQVLYDIDGGEIGEYRVEIENPIPIGNQISIGPIGSSLPFPIRSSNEPVVRASAGVPDLTSLGSEIRIVEVNAKAQTVFSFGLFSNSDLEIGGTALVNSYNSTLGTYGLNGNMFNNGDAGANGNILLNGSPLIDGDASAGGNVVIVGNKAEITGEVDGGMTHIDLPPVSDFVEQAKLKNDNNQIPKAVKANGQLVDAYNPATGLLNVAAGATLNLPGGTKDNPKVYYLSGSTLNGNSNLIVDDYVIIFTDGNMNWNGGTVINNGGNGPPERLMVYSSGGLDTTISVNGGAGFAGVVYAPAANLVVTGNGHFFGAAVGGNVDVSGNGEFHYDEALGDVGPVAFFEVQEWTEKPNL
jgi:hypothetical protein